MKTQQYGTVLHWGDFAEMDRKSMYSKNIKSLKPVYIMKGM